MRLIDRDAIHWRPDENWELYATAADIRAIPIVDAVVVTRCKDCKHFNHKRMECENEAISTDHEGGAQYSLNFWPDDFCSYGEPKEGDHA